MRLLDTVTLQDVRAVYSGAEAKLWQLIMGAQIHMGGLGSSLDLAKKAGVRPGSCGVDLCCALGAGMECLIRFCQAGRMTGVDATEAMIEQGRARIESAGLSEHIRFVHADACDTGLPGECFDFAWGEDAWCYVADKRALVQEATRLVRPNGKIAFTDWIEGPVPLSADEARRFMAFMKFPSLANLQDYAGLLEQSGCRVDCSEDTGRFAPCIDLYLAMLDQQLGYDALAIVGFNRTVVEAIRSEMAFAGRLAREGKLAQRLFVATRH